MRSILKGSRGRRRRRRRRGEEDAEKEEEENEAEEIAEENKSSEWQALSQMTAQLYDLCFDDEKELLKVTMMQHGILCTGRIWRFFSLVWKVRNDPLDLHFGRFVLRRLKHVIIVILGNLSLLV